jgi:hypothetical protein
MCTTPAAQVIAAACVQSLSKEGPCGHICAACAACMRPHQGIDFRCRNHNLAWACRGTHCSAPTVGYPLMTHVHAVSHCTPALKRHVCVRDLQMLMSKKPCKVQHMHAGVAAHQTPAPGQNNEGTTVPRPEPTIFGHESQQDAHTYNK